MEAIIGLATEVGNCIAGPVKRQFNYLCCFNNNIQILRDEAQKLDDANDGLQMRVNRAENNAQVIYPQVTTWLESASQSKDIISGIENDVPKVQKGCLNLISRYSLSRKAKKTAEALRELRNDCKFDEISQDVPPATMESLPLGPKEKLETRKEIEEDVMEALRNGNINMIGLYGRGGIGKTTMAEKIMDRVREEKLFDKALKVVVSQQVKMSTIQQSIANQLNLTLGVEDLATRAREIHERLTTDTKRILIVFDDVWDSLKLQDLGIPSGSSTSRKCTILLTSRDKSVLEIMETESIFEIKILPEREAWLLFREKTGNCADREDLRSVAEDIAKECKGLPAALVIVGEALKNKERRELWDDALVQLRSSNPEHLPKVLAHVYKPLKLSYDYLEDKDARSLFLLCSMFEEDVDINLEMLTQYGMGLNMFEGLRNLTEARNRTCALIELLKDRSLLLDGFDRNFVKMHDVVRDVAIYTASKEKRGGFVIDFDQRNWENCHEHCFWISVTNLSNKTEFPMEFKCPSARLLMMQSGKGRSYNKELTLPDNFFDGMQEIRVLSMENIHIKSLPPTTHLLKNLKTLHLYYCPALESISVVGELLKLEILSCIGCHIEALPREIGRLNRLRLLEIINCRNLKKIVRGTISTLISLEELKIIDSFNGWEAKESTNTEENVALVELEPLTKLTCLEIEINNASLVAEEICLPSQIVKYDIAIMKERKVPFLIYCRKMYLEIPRHEMSVGNWIKRLLRSTELLYLRGDGASQLVNLVELDKLKKLYLDSCSLVKTLVNTTGVFPLLEFLRLNSLDNLKEIMNSHNFHMAFPNLKNLELEHLPRLLIAQETLDKIVAPDNLRELHLKGLKDDAINSIWCVFSYFRNLERIYIHGLNGIKNLMSSSIAINLVHLKTLHVNYCEMMLEVIASDDEGGQVPVVGQISLFPRLERLGLYYLRKLRSFCQYNHHNTTLELPSLEHVSISSCPQMETFAQQSVRTPKLRKGELDWRDVEIKDLNGAIQPHLNVESRYSLPAWSSRPSGGKSGTNLHHYMKQKRFQSPPMPLPSIEEVRVDSPERYRLKGGEEIHDEDVPPADYLESYGLEGGEEIHDEDVLTADYLESYGLEGGEEIHDEDVPPADYLESYGLERGEEIHDEDVPPADYPESSGLKQGEQRHEEDVSPHSFSEGHKDQICHAAELAVSGDMVLHENRYLKDCILFCSGFPSDYGFTRDMLVWQWIAEGLIKLEKDEIIEEVCIHCFDTLLKLDYIVPCGYDHCFDNTIYNVGDKMKAFLQEQLLKPKFRSYSDINESDVGKIEHLSLDSKEIDHIDFGILKQCSSLQTLIIHRCYGMQVKHLPCDLFLKLKDLKILNLSHTNIEELPSSVVNLRELRYLDMSETPISWLPESIHCLGNLQTLKLDGCLSLTELPKCTSELINLQHLVLDVVQLQSMPKGIGKLLKLRTLRAFLIGEEDGNRIGELENMNKLKGSFDLLNLEYVMSKEEAAEARLCNKRDLKKIDLHWSDLQDEKNPNEEGILESLQPPVGIQELTIIFYSGGMLPSWISNPSFSEIVSVILYKCRYVGSLPSLGELPSLKLLKIVENHEVKEINNSFCRKQTDQHPVAFPKLEKLSFGTMYKLEKWTGIENGDFPSLRSLIIECCPKLAALPFLSHLNSLSHMEIRSCQELSCFPEGGLPATLGCLMITDCPGLKSRCCDEQCEDWSKVAHVPDLYIDCQKVSVQP